MHPSSREVIDHSATAEPMSHGDEGVNGDNDSRSSSDRVPRKRGGFSRGTGGVSKERAATARGVTLSLDDVGLQDDTLCRVGVHKGLVFYTGYRADLGKTLPPFHSIPFCFIIFSLLRNVSDRKFISRYLLMPKASR